MLTVTQMIHDLGGMPSVARTLGVSAQAIWNMKARGCFPPKHWPALVRAASQKGVEGVTFDALEAQHKAAAGQDESAGQNDTQQAFSSSPPLGYGT